MDINRYYIKLVLRWLWLLILMPLVAGATTYWISHRQAVVYTASSRLLFGPVIDSPNPDLNALRTGGKLMHTYADMATARPLLQSIIDDLKLQISPDLLLRQITITPNDLSQFMTVSVQDSDPDRAAVIANALAGALVHLSPTSVDGSATQLQEQMNAEAAKLQADIDASEARIKQWEMDYQAVAVVTSQHPTSQTLEQMLTDVQARITKLEVDLQNAATPGEQGEILDQLAQEQSRLAELQSKEDLLKSIAEQQARMTKLEADLQATNNPVLQRLILDQMTAAQNSLVELGNTRAQAQSLIVNQIAQERTRLTNTHQSLATLYTSLQNTTTSNQVTVVDPAVAGVPRATQLSLRVMMGVVAGFLVALTIALAAEYFNETIRSAEDLAPMKEVVILDTIANHKRLRGVGRSRTVVQALSKSRAAESYRLLSTKLLLGQGDKRAKNSVLVTGLRATDNTSEIAANLAVALAQTGNRVTLVDANLRKPIIGPLLGIADQRGLTEMLAEQPASLELALVDWAPGLLVLPGGLVPSNFFEVLASPRMTDLLEQLERQADIVIVAAAPLLSFAESLVLASRIGSVILVARPGQASRKEISQALESLDTVNAHMLGVILNQSHGGPVPRQRRTPSPAARQLNRPIESARTLGTRLLTAIRHTHRPMVMPIVPSRTRMSLPTADGKLGDDGLASK